MLHDAVATGTGFMRDGKRIDPQDARTKVSSLELASLAAVWLSADMKTLDKALAFDREGVLAEIKRLAASVLAQAEGNPRK